jgi:aspartyl-tRNA(Asn)/glutamyl-tRNA(Gln) amidotransferase subunit A
LTRSVEDAALLLAVMQGADPRTLALRDADPLPALRRGVKGLRLARMAAANRTRVAAEVFAAYDRSVDQLASMGADLVDLVLPRTFRDYGAASGRIMAAEAYALLSRIAALLDRRPAAILATPRQR